MSAPTRPEAPGSGGSRPVPRPPAPRRRAWARGVRRQLFFLAVCTAVVVGLVFVALAYWRRGLFVIGGAAVAAAVLRLVLPTRQAGWLVVRSRAVDVCFYATFGVGIVALAVAIIG